MLGAAIEGERAIVARLHAEGGKLVERDRHTLEAPDGEGTAGVYRAFIPQYYAERSSPTGFSCRSPCRPGHRSVA